MKMHSTYEINAFLILLGYKSYYINGYFANYFLHQKHIIIDLWTNQGFDC